MSRRRFLFSATALLVAPAASAQIKQPPLAVPLKWYAVKADDNAFIVEMPGVPDHRLLDDRSARGTAFVLHSYSIDAGGYSYVAQTALYPADVDVSQPRRILQAAIDGRAPQLAGRKWSTVDWREVSGGAAVETTGALPNGSGLRQLAVLKGHRFVSLAFLGPQASLNGVEANRFIRSLKVP
jgi:hypothetical protein